MTQRSHPFPFRTRKLSSAVLMILGGRLPGKVSRRRILYSSLAQSVERMTVNHDVAGSSPAGGATSEQVSLVPIFLCKKISHLLHCSSFFAKGHVQVGYSFVNALITPLFHYQPFARECLRHRHLNHSVLPKIQVERLGFFIGALRRK